MKPIRLFTGLLAAATVVLASCSAPRMAQQSNDSDDVYNSVARAKEYVQPVPSQSAQYKDNTHQNDDYGNSDPYYDMDYSSRINRFYYGSTFRNYYDPYYNDYYGYNSFSPWYSSGFSLGFGWGWGNSYFGNYWNSPYFGWGINSPYYAWNPYYGGGYLGGYYGGGYYGGGYANNLRGNTTYGPRPDRGRENGVGYSPGANSGNYIGRGATRSNNGVISSERSRSERYNPNRSNPINPNATGRTDRTTQPYSPPQRSNTENRPTYTPPSSSNNNSGSGNTQSSGGGGGRSQRSGGRN